MTLHRISSIVMGVPHVEKTIDYYVQFGLSPGQDGWLSTTDGGAQLRVVYAPTRRLLEITIGADDRDDIDKIGHQVRALGLAPDVGQTWVSAIEPITAVKVTVEIASRIIQVTRAATPYNGPGRADRETSRAPGILREGQVRPRKLGHVVIGSVDQPATQRFFTDGIGLKISDVVPGMAAFMRCSMDHHNVLVTNAPVNFLHHTSWQVDDIDEIGRGAMNMLENHPERHTWGLGRHHIGSNFFWYLKDPAGNFSEYYSDMDCVIDEELWKPHVWDEAQSLFSWGPPPPDSFIHPEDLAALMTGAHSAP